MFISASGQVTSTDTSAMHRSRLTTVVAVTGSLTAASYIALNGLWYKDYPRSAFHLFNDNGEWLQMDKAGHFMSAYCLGSAGYEMMSWCGVKERTSVLTGGTFGFLYLTGIEILDAHSSQWGFSAGDELANLGGSLLFVGQQLWWKDQRLKLKFSFSPTSYPEYRPDLLGENYLQQSLKDYNGQTYWLSINIASFLGDNNRFPKWLNFATGYGAEGMTGARNNSENTNDIDRYRQIYFSLDIDLSRIETKNKTLNTIKYIFNFIKIPFPTVEYSVNKAWSFHPVYF